MGDLTPAQREFLERALDLQERFDAGIFPTGSSQHQMVMRLEGKGLLRFDGWGRDMDGDGDRSVPIWRLTEKGTSASRTTDSEGQG